MCSYTCSILAQSLHLTAASSPRQEMSKSAAAASLVSRRTATIGNFVGTGNGSPRWFGEEPAVCGVLASEPGGAASDAAWGAALRACRVCSVHAATFKNRKCAVSYYQLSAPQIAKSQIPTGTQMQVGNEIATGQRRTAEEASRDALGNGARACRAADTRNQQLQLRWTRRICFSAAGLVRDCSH